MSCTVNDLPKEVLCHVFSNLNIPDRLNVSLVCKRWLNVINCKSLLRGIKVIINNNNNIPILCNMSRNFLNFEFRFVIICSQYRYYELFKHFSPYAEFMSFENCEIWEDDVSEAEYDLTFESLAVLRINRCNLWSNFLSFPNVTELYLSNSNGISDSELAVLQKTMKHLKILTVGCKVAVDLKAYKRFYINGNSYENNPSSLIFSLPAVKSFISERVKTLEELNIYFDLSIKALDEIFSIKNLRLTKVCLTKCVECLSGLVGMFRNQPSLKKLYFRSGVVVDDNTISALCALLPNIEELSIQSCSFSEKSVIEMFQLKKLIKLDIGRSLYSLDRLTRRNISLRTLPSQLRSLNVSRIPVEDFDIFVRQCKYLIHLDISSCYIEDEIVHLISENLIHLEYFNVSDTKITDYALTAATSSDHCQNLKSLSNLKHLKTLNLSYTLNVTDFGLIQAVHFDFLELLHIVGCHIQNDTVISLLHQNPRIKKIFCDNDVKCPDPRVKTRSDLVTHNRDPEINDMVCYIANQDESL